MGDQRLERRAQPDVVGIAERKQRAASALDEERRLTAEQDDVGAGDARRAAGRSLRPGKHTSVGLGRIGGGQYERVGSRRPARTQLAQALDRAGERELGSAEPLDEVAAAAESQHLERLQLAVDGAVAARDSLGANAVAGHDALALEQELGQRSPVRAAPNSGGVSDQRPWVAVGAWAREREKRRGRRSLLRGLEAARGAQRLPGVVRRLARPDEIPERGQRQLGVERGGGKQLVPEERAAGERAANLLVRFALGALRRGRRPSSCASSRK